MCELLVMARSQVGDDIYRDAKLPKRGDVVTIQEDGWKWGKLEVSGDLFTIIQVPGVPVEKMAYLLGAELPGPDQPDAKQGDLTNTLKYRTNRLNLAALSKAAVTETDITAARETKPAIPDPRVIGASKRIF